MELVSALSNFVIFLDVDEFCTHRHASKLRSKCKRSMYTRSGLEFNVTLYSTYISKTVTSKPKNLVIFRLLLL